MSIERWLPFLPVLDWGVMGLGIPVEGKTGYPGCAFLEELVSVD